MTLGMASIAFGYALFYWGYHHLPNTNRYSLWALLGVGTLFNSPVLTAQTNQPASTAVQFQ